jgi:hypothetical protein
MPLRLICLIVILGGLLPSHAFLVSPKCSSPVPLKEGSLTLRYSLDGLVEVAAYSCLAFPFLKLAYDANVKVAQYSKTLESDKMSPKQSLRTEIWEHMNRVSMKIEEQYTELDEAMDEFEKDLKDHFARLKEDQAERDALLKWNIKGGIKEG